MSICSFFSRHFSRHGCCQRWMLRGIACKLKLEEQQKSQLSAVFDNFKQLREQVRSGWTGRRQEINALLSAERFDRVEALRIAQAQLALIGESLPKLLDAFAEFYDSMTAAQRERLRDRIANRLDHRCCGH